MKNPSKIYNIHIFDKEFINWNGHVRSICYCIVSIVDIVVSHCCILWESGHLSAVHPFNRINKQNRKEDHAFVFDRSFVPIKLNDSELLHSFHHCQYTRAPTLCCLHKKISVVCICVRCASYFLVLVALSVNTKQWCDEFFISTIKRKRWMLTHSLVRMPSSIQINAVLRARLSTLSMGSRQRDAWIHTFPFFFLHILSLA